jgi:hypothetical protein
MWVNGVSVFNFIDGASNSNSAGIDDGGGNTPAYTLPSLRPLPMNWVRQRRTPW